MSMTDPIADLLTRIRNANQKAFEKLEVPHSKFKEEIVKILPCPRSHIPSDTTCEQFMTP